MLATNVHNQLIVTDLCRALASSDNPLSSDEYLNFVFSRFTLPFTAFEDYDAKTAPLFPFVSIIKFLMVNYKKGVR